MDIPKTEVLITVAGAERGRHIFAPGEYIIGREAGCLIHIDDSELSRHHAKLTLHFDHALIEDLGSSNGTFVNDKPVTGVTRLWPNQKIRVGPAATITLRRLKSESAPDVTLAPTQEVVKRMLPEAFLREKKYDIGEVLARGGMGAILDAREAAIERSVAMKVMLDVNDTDAVARFIAEAKVTGQLEHPNIVPVHELGVDENGQPYYTMKMVRGITLKKVLELLASGVEATVKKYPLAALLTIFQKVCDALAFAHSKGVIHRDLKPENIMLGDYGEVLVMDWGLAKVLGKNDECRMTNDEGAGSDSSFVIRHSSFSATLAGSIMGTPQYMAPEQARGEVGTMDQRADIYALGAILFHILALRPPVSGTDAWEIVGKVGRGEIEPLDCGSPLPLSDGARSAGWEDRTSGDQKRQRTGALQKARGRAIPESLAAVVKKAMALDKSARYARVEDLQADVLAYQNGFATGAEKAGAWKQFTLLVKRNKAASIGVAMVAILSVAFTMRVLHEKNAALLEGKRAERGEALAQSEAGRANRALADFKATAPGLRNLADSEAGFQRFDSALNKLDAALILDPAHLPGYWRRAWLLVGMERFSEAAEAIRVAQQKDSANAKLAAILPTIEQLAAAPAEERWNEDRAGALLAHLELVGATGEAIVISRKIELGSAAKVKLVSARLKQWYGGHANANSTGGISVTPLKTVDTVEPLRGLPITELNLMGTRVTDLGPLQGMPINKLNVNGTPVTDLEPLRGMPLRFLYVAGCQIRDISPLRDMPLQELHLNGAFVSDLSALRGMPLRFLNVNGTKISDLAPLRGMPLEYLHLFATAVRDLSPLKGMPLRFLGLNSTKVSDLSPLHGMPLEVLDLTICPATDLSPLRGMRLKNLNAQSNDFSPLAGMNLTFLEISTIGSADFSTLRGLTVEQLHVKSTTTRDLTPLSGLRVKVLDITNCTSLRDLSPLLECTELEELKAMKCPAPIEPLRAHKTLKIISYSTPGTPGFVQRPVEQFWKEYDAQRAAPK